MVGEPQWQQWISLATATLGLFIGAGLSELHVVLAGARERRRAFNVLLFDLLELRRDVCNSDPRKVIDTLFRVMQRKVGEEAAQVVTAPEFRAVIISVQKEIVGSDRLKLTQRYENALRSLVPHDPMLAYSLTGSERIVALERAIALYYEKVALHPEVARDANAPKFLGVMEGETTMALIGEAGNDLAADIKRVAQARRWWPFRLPWTPFAVQYALRRQDNIPTAKMEEELEQLIDRVLPKLVNALHIAAMP